MMIFNYSNVMKNMSYREAPSPAALARGSLIAWLSILGGGCFGVKFLEVESFGGAVRAVLVRS